jgi:hypothetical protein
MLKTNQKRSQFAITLIWICLIVNLISLFSSYLQFQLLTQLSKGVEIANYKLEQNDSREQLVGIVTLIVSIISAVAFIQWFRRAYFNLHSLVPNLTYSEGWAAGSWFVPVIGFFRPYQIMVELYNKTIARLVERKLFENQSFDLSFVKVWWALWIIVSIIGRVVYKFISEAETLDKFIDCTIFSMVESILYIPLSLITIKVIKVYSNFENILFNDVTIEPVLNLDSDNKVL